MRKIIFCLFCVIAMVPQLALAIDLAQFSQNMMEPVAVFADFMGTAFILLGVSFIFIGIVRYFQYRENPLAYPLSTVFFLLIFGVMFLIIPLIYMVAESGAPFSYIFTREFSNA